MAPKRKTLSFEEKGVILDKLNRGMRVIAVANEYGVNESTIRTIRKNREKIRAALQAGNAASSKSLRSASNIVLARTEKILLKYLHRQAQAGIGVDNTLLRKKACHFYGVVAEKIFVMSPQPYTINKNIVLGKDYPRPVICIVLLGRVYPPPRSAYGRFINAIFISQPVKDSHRVSCEGHDEKGYITSC